MHGGLVMAPSFVESPVVFGRDQSLVGMVCRPTEPSGGPFVVFLNAGIIHRTGPNRIYVSIARALAREGVWSLRFDLSGIGDSLAPLGVEGISTQERVGLDVGDAFDFLQARFQATRFVLIGLCSGADNALRTMGRDPRVVGSVLLDLNVHRTVGFYLRHYARRAARAESWRNVLTGRHPAYRLLAGREQGARGAVGEPGELGDAAGLNVGAEVPRDLMRQHLEVVVRRRGKLLCIFTAGLEEQYNYCDQFLHLFPNLDFRGCLRLEYFADADHTFSRVALRERLIDTIVEWMSECDFRSISAEPSPLMAGDVADAHGSRGA